MGAGRSIETSITIYPVAKGTSHAGRNFYITAVRSLNLMSITILVINLLTPNDHYSGRTAPLTSKSCILHIYSSNIGTKYFKHCVHSPFLSLQNAVCFIILNYLVPVLFTFYIQGVLNLKKNNSGAKCLTSLMNKLLFYNKFILSLYMFRALLCSSSGGQNCIIQHLVSSHSVGGRPVRRCTGWTSRDQIQSAAERTPLFEK